MNIFNIETDLKAIFWEMSEQDLMTYMKLQETSFSEALIELKIMIHVVIYHKKKRIEYFEHARHLSKTWLADSVVDDFDRTYREKIWYIVSAFLIRKTLVSEKPENGDAKRL